MSNRTYCKLWFAFECEHIRARHYLRMSKLNTWVSYAVLFRIERVISNLRSYVGRHIRRSFGRTNKWQARCDSSLARLKAVNAVMDDDN